MSHHCDVVKVKFLLPGEQHYKHAIWVGTNICIGFFVWLEGNLKKGMKVHALNDYALIYPSLHYPTEFIGTIDCTKLGEFNRIWLAIEPPCRQLDRQGNKIAPAVPLFDAEDWVRLVIERLWSEGVLERAAETRVLLGDTPGYLNGYPGL